MLVKLVPEQISQNWKAYIEPAIKGSVPLDLLTSKVKLVNILEALLSGSMDCWWSVVEHGGEKQVLACIITTIVQDFDTKTKILRIFSLYGFTDIPVGEWQQGLRTILAYAKASSCELIDGFTENPSIISFVKALGGDTRYTYIVVEVKNEPNLERPL